MPATANAVLITLADQLGKEKLLILKAKPRSFQYFFSHNFCLLSLLYIKITTKFKNELLIIEYKTYL